MLEIGSLVDGKYRILRVVGSGGMSVVYQAVNEKANKIWAIKEVRKDGVQNYEVVKQNLIVETELLKRFNHPNLPSIIDVIDGDGTFLIVMDYIEGNSLKAALENGAQSQDDVIEWSKQLCDVLGYLHSRKPPIIYRDMKPANVMLKPDGKISLIDFGTAREFKSTSVEDTTCLGTQGYAAPEQYGGHGQTDARTDIYCLGATMYHLVTGHNPSVYPYEMRPIRQWNPALSSGLERIILKCTQRNPDDRYQSCAEVLYALDHYRELDEETERKQNIKWRMFITTIILTLVMAVASVGFVIAKGMTATQTYDSLIEEARPVASSNLNASITEEEKQKAEDSLMKAINVDPSNVEAYKMLIDVYLNDKVLSVEEYSNLETLNSMHRDKLKAKSEYDYINSFVIPLAERVFFNFERKTGTSGTGIKSSEIWFKTALDSGQIAEKNQRKVELLHVISANYGDVGKFQGTEVEYDSDQYWSDLVGLIDTDIAKETNTLIALRMYNFVASEIYDNVADMWSLSNVDDASYKAALQKIKAATERIKSLKQYKNNESELSNYYNQTISICDRGIEEGLGNSKTETEEGK